MQVLTFPRDNFDQDSTFAFQYEGFRGATRTATGYLFYAEDEQQLYVLKKSSCLKASYTQKDHEERDRLNSMKPVKTGDVVTVDGKQYTVKILGDYSDAGRLYPV